MTGSLDLLVAMYSTCDAMQAARVHLLQMERGGMVEVADRACIRCLSRHQTEFWTPLNLDQRPRARAIIDAVDPALLGISQSLSMDAAIGRRNPEWGVIEEFGDLPLAVEIRDYLLPGMAGLVLVVESPWLANVLQGIDGYERLLQRRLIPSTGKVD